MREEETKERRGKEESRGGRGEWPGYRVPCLLLNMFVQSVLLCTHMFISSIKTRESTCKTPEAESNPAHDPQNLWECWLSRALQTDEKLLCVWGSAASRPGGTKTALLKFPSWWKWNLVFYFYFFARCKWVNLPHGQTWAFGSRRFTAVLVSR